ncbi:MAG: helix-turn-helix domain-containing protein [Oscillospiraceae bacterium]|nr:helix-turn-helix domain-containing protein [Oscillospiraceae bacterium]
MDKKVTKSNTNEKTGNIDMFKGRLKEERINAGITSQEALAEKVEVDRVTINYYEQGRRKPDIDVFIKIADKLNVSYDYLLGYSESPKRENHDTKELTELSNKAIEMLKEFLQLNKEAMEEYSHNSIFGEITNVLNFLIENEYEYRFLTNMASFLWFYRNNKDEIEEERNIPIGETDRERVFD